VQACARGAYKKTALPAGRLAGWYRDCMREANEPAATDETLRTAVDMIWAGYTHREVTEATGLTTTYVARVVQSKAKRRAPGAKYVARDIHDLMAGCPDIGAALRSARVRQGLTQHQLAWGIGGHGGSVGTR
jgi:hypothetical protein